MHHLNPFRFYELAAKLYGLFVNTTQNRVTDMFGPLTEAQAALDSLIKGDPVPLESSKNDAKRLLSKMSGVFNKYYIDPATKQLRTPEGEDRIDPHEMAMIRSLVEKFEHALAADLNRAPSYLASKRGIYSTYDLIENAYQTFSPNLLSIISQDAQNEFTAAGRALAFGLGTATAMHLLRAVEIVLKQYYELYSGTTVAKTERSYNIYLKKLATLSEEEGNLNRPDKRLLQMLAQIKEHYRNPLTVPESSVSVDQATSLFGLACAVITLMAEQILAKQAKAVKGAKEALSSVAEAGNDEESEESYSFKTSQAG
jgi:hypothetical protein